MIRTCPAKGRGVDGRGYRLESEDLDVLYERSVLHAQHGSSKKVLLFVMELKIGD